LNRSKSLHTKLAVYAVPSDAVTINNRVDSIPHDLILKPNISIGIYLQEAFNLYYYMQADKEELCSKGLDWRLVEELPRRIDFLRESEAKWYSIRYSDTPSARELKKLHAIVDESRKELLVSMKYAFFEDPLIQVVKYIERGNTDADYTQDLWGIAELAERHIKELQAIGCDCHHIEVLKENREIYADLQAACNMDEINKPKVLKFRDKAYTFLSVAVEAIRRSAHYALWNDKKRLRGYASEYFRKSTRRGNDK
jgi:hypothetical protein